MTKTVQEPLRDRVGRALYEEPGCTASWYDLSEERREPWRQDADRIIPIVQRDYSAVVAERNRAQKACEQIARRLQDAEARSILSSQCRPSSTRHTNLERTRP